MQNSNTNTGVQTSEDLVRLVQSRKMISQPGAYDLKVTAVTAYNGNHIVNLAAMCQAHIEKAQEYAELGQLQQAANEQYSLNARPTDYLPSKGEIIKVYFDTVTTKKGITGLFPTSYSELKSAPASKVVFSFGSLKSTTETISSTVKEKEFA
jgi:hypothetical protein